METPIRASIQRRIMGILGAILVIMVIVACLTFWTTNRMIRDRDSIARDHHILADLHETRALLDDAEDQERGYLITGDPSLLTAFEGETLVRRFQEKLSSLRSMVEDDLEQLRRLDQLEREGNRKFEAMRSLIETRRQQGPGKARDELVADLGNVRADSTSATILEMVSAERVLLEDRIAKARSNDLLALFLLLVCLLTFFWMIAQNLRKQARSATELRKSREQFEIAVRGSNDGLWDWDIESDSVYYSPRWKSQLGYNDEEISARFDEFDSRLHPEDRDRVLNSVRAYLDGHLQQFEVELRMRAKDGSFRWILSRGVALRDAHGAPFRMAGSHTDITERKEVERKLAEQNQRLEWAMRAEQETNEALRQAQAVMVQNEKMAALGQMVAGVAHEINNPLAFITNNVTVLQRDFHELQQMLQLYESTRSAIARESPELDRQIREFRDQVEVEETLNALPDLLSRTSEGLKRIRQIVKDLRLFARLDEGEINEADLNEGIQSTITIIKGHAKDKDVRLRLALEPLPLVTCHAARVNQVVMNLLTNAIDACTPGGSITVRTKPLDGQVQVEVIDDGHGISATIKDRIFDPFFTTKPIGKGTGLGLSISHSIIRDHGGTISVDSSPGQGSKFTIRLPLHPKVKPNGWTESPQQAPSEPSTAAGKTSST